MEQKVQKILEELEVTGKQSNFWNVPRTSGLFLNLMVKLLKAKNVLEIGTSNGYSGIFFAEALSHTGGRLYTVESHKERFALARANFEKSGLQPFIEQIFGHAPEVFKDVEKLQNIEFDLAFVDATKMEYKSYIEAFWPLLKKGGLIIADNSTSHGEDMKSYLDFVSNNPDMQSVLLPVDNGLMLTYKL